MKWLCTTAEALAAKARVLSECVDDPALPSEEKREKKEKEEKKGAQK